MTDRLDLPDTLATQAILTSTYMNTYVKDNVTSLDTGYGCKLKTDTAQTLTTANDTPLTFDAETFDDNSLHSTSTNPSRITIPDAGRYLVIGYAAFATSNVGSRRLEIRINGMVQNRVNDAAPSSGGPCYLSLSEVVVLTAGQYVELSAIQSSGGDLNITERSLSVTKYI